MSSEVDPKALEAARTAYDAARMEWERPLMHTNPDPLAAAIQAYLRSASPSIGRVGEDAARALELLAAEDARNDKIHDLLETIREQIRLQVAPEHRPNGLMTNIQNAVYAMRGRMRLMNDAAITSPLSTLVYHEEPAGDTQGAGLEAIAKYICETILNTKWETLPEGRITARGFKPIIYSEYGGMKFQGDRGDLLDFAARLAALVSPPDNGEAVAWTSPETIEHFRRNPWIRADIWSSQRGRESSVPLYTRAALQSHNEGSDGK